MGNMHCPAEDAALLASVARDICPFPNYNPNPVYMDMLSLNSSHHLRSHYAAVQSSLTPKQREDFTRELRSTFGREGRVTLGGVGVVALSLAVLFDTLAKQVKGEPVPDSGPIPNLFLKDPRGRYPSNVNMISEYLRLVPHIANNPERMREETKRYLKEIFINKKEAERKRTEMKEDIAGINLVVLINLQNHMLFHLQRISNSTEVDEATSKKQEKQCNPVNTESSSRTTASASHVGKKRKRGIRPPSIYVTFSFNCNPKEASMYFDEEVVKSRHTSKAMRACEPRWIVQKETLLHHIASLVWLDFANNDFDSSKRRSLRNQREDFDLKAGALGGWIESHTAV